MLRTYAKYLRMSTGDDSVDDENVDCDASENSNGTDGGIVCDDGEDSKRIPRSRANISKKKKAPSQTQVPVGSAMPKERSIMSRGVSSGRHWIAILVRFWD